MCDCVSILNKDLREKYNTQIVVPIAWTKDAMESMGPLVATEKYDKNKRGKPITLMAAYCPFCGEKYPEKHKEDEVK